jgi:hypothetical protein
VNDYYLENSSGMFNISGDVIGWTTAANSYAGYEDPYGGMTTYSAYNMLIDAIAELDAVVDYS